MDLKYRMAAVVVALGMAVAAHAQSPLLDDVETRVAAEGTEIRLRFTAPVRYLRHFPAQQGELLRIVFQVTALDGVEAATREDVRRVAATAALPSFTVTCTPPPSRDTAREPASVLLQFDRPVHYKVGEGSDKRSLYVHVALAASKVPPQ